jgi:hypothetical protein
MANMPWLHRRRSLMTRMIAVSSGFHGNHALAASKAADRRADLLDQAELSMANMPWLHQRFRSGARVKIGQDSSLIYSSDPTRQRLNKHVR